MNLKLGTVTLFFRSILGMNLFGCKFCDAKLKGQKAEDQVCDRKNFDTLLWAIVTVFQVIIYAQVANPQACWW